MDITVQKKIVMLLSNGFDPDPRVYQEAISLIKHDFDVTIIAWDRDKKMVKNEVYEGINIERIHIKSYYSRGTLQVFFFILFWISIFFKLIRRDFDVIHCHDFDTLPCGIIIGKLKKRKIIFDAHESYIDMLLKDTPGIRCIKKIISFMETLSLRYIDELITVGELLKEEYIKKGVKNVWVVGNWKLISDFEFPNEQIELTKQQLRIPENKLIISFIGWLNEDREIFPLIEAVKRTNSIFLLLGGDGSLVEKIKEEIKDSNNIYFIGFVHPGDIPIYTAISDVIYYGLKKGFPLAKYSAPNKLFEGLAAGKAILTGNFGEIGKIVKEEDCGVIVNSFIPEEITKAFNLLLQEDVLTRFKTNAKNAAIKRYNWFNAEKTLLEVYNHLLFNN